MEISNEQLAEFILLYKEVLGTEISPQEAQQKALSLIAFLQIPFIPFDLPEINDTIENA